MRNDPADPDRPTKKVVRVVGLTTGSLAANPHTQRVYSATRGPLERSLFLRFRLSHNYMRVDSRYAVEYTAME